MVPSDNPVSAYDMFGAFLHGDDLPAYWSLFYDY